MKAEPSHLGRINLVSTDDRHLGMIDDGGGTNPTMLPDLDAFPSQRPRKARAPNPSSGELRRERMAMSCSRIPHLTDLEEADVTELAELRAAEQSQAKGPAEAHNVPFLD